MNKFIKVSFLMILRVRRVSKYVVKLNVYQATITIIFISKKTFTMIRLKHQKKMKHVWNQTQSKQFSELSQFNARHLNAIYVSLGHKHRANIFGTILDE